MADEAGNIEMGRREKLMNWERGIYTLKKRGREGRGQFRWRREWKQ